jgi:hypothetical protein
MANRPRNFFKIPLLSELCSSSIRVNFPSFAGPKTLTPRPQAAKISPVAEAETAFDDFQASQKSQKNQSRILTHFVFVEEEMPLCFYQVEGVSSPGSNVGQGTLRDRSIVL